MVEEVRGMEIKQTQTTHIFVVYTKHEKDKIGDSLLLLNQHECRTLVVHQVSQHTA